MINCHRRAWLRQLTLFPLGAAWGTASQAQHQTQVRHLPRHIQVMAAVSAGGGPDRVARAIAAYAEARHGIQMSIRNLPQVHGETARAQFLELPADTQTVLLAPDSVLTVNPHIYPRTSPDPLFGLQPLAQTGGNAFMLAVRAEDTIKNLDDWLQQARTSALPMNYGSGGVGSMHHLYMVDLADRMQLRLNHVAYQGGGKAAAGLVRGDVRVALIGASALPLVRAGKLRLLALASATRSPHFEGLPTLSERVPGFIGTAWYGWFARSGAPVPMMNALGDLLRMAMADAQVQDDLRQGLMDASYMPATALAEQVQQDLQRFRRVVSLISNLKS